MFFSVTYSILNLVELSQYKIYLNKNDCKSDNDHQDVTEKKKWIRKPLYNNEIIIFIYFLGLV